MAKDKVYSIGSYEEIPEKYRKLKALIKEWEREAHQLKLNGTWTEENELELKLMKIILQDMKCVLEGRPHDCLLIEYPPDDRKNVVIQ
ncbi:hypothetical protein ACFO25_05520 [Paenactinomyces guangxiensis]|uniref:Uncharacterized protein n=1 Tax=Paenactinomyces guangxiensis TaxID=1490290 RepID=A0A7W1WQX2_9BACL|nr:hypothetical protein [Paenactinomyces guangxiensis]MBA4494308.1 hypothetical protein [Paenactinomyces guangxiensis]MBH8590802.1 hypothetical protein [Paenactinomyces guangxiensis]